MVNHMQGSPIIRAARNTSGIPSVFRPEWILAALAIFQPLASGARGFSEPLGQGLMFAADAVLLGVLVAYSGRFNNLLLRIALIFTVIAVMMTLLIPNYPMFGLVNGIRKSFLILFAMIVGTYVPENRRLLVNRGIFISCTIVAIYGIKQHFYFDNFDENLLLTFGSDKYTNLFQGEHRAFSLLSSGFHAGLVCIMLASYCIFTRVFPRYIRWPILPISLAALYFTYTRTCIGIVLMIVLLRLIRLARVPVLFVAPLALIAYIMMMFAAPNVVPNPLESALSDTRFTGRSVSYTEALDAWKQNTVQIATGFGIGSAGSAQTEIFAGTGNDQIEPHNIFLKYVFEMGWILGTTFLGVLAGAIYKARKNAKQTGMSSFIDALLIAVVVSGLSITTVEAWPANVYFFMVFGMYVNPARQAAAARALSRALRPRGSNRAKLHAALRANP